MSGPYLAVIIPAYNEEDRLASTLARTREYLAAQSYSWSVVVVSDGSRDRTLKIAQQFAAEDERFRVIDSQPNRGKGWVVRRGMLEVEADWMLFSDADLATPIEEIEKLWAAVQDETPIAIGSRPLRESNLEVRQPFYREMLGRCFNLAVQTLGIRGIADTQCGFKLFSRSAATQVFERCKVDGFGFDFEALMIARDLGLAIAEVPIRWRHQEGSKVVLLRDGPRMLRDLIKLRLAGKRRRLAPRAD